MAQWEDACLHGHRVRPCVQFLAQWKEGERKGLEGKGGGREERRRRRCRERRWGRRGRWVICAVLALDWVFRNLDIYGSACQIICIKLEKRVKIHRRIKRSICAPHSVCDEKMTLQFRAR